MTLVFAQFEVQLILITTAGIMHRNVMIHVNNALLQNHRYLELLGVLCYCDGVAMSDNQIHITNAWLVEGDRVHINSLTTVYLFVILTDLVAFVQD